MIQHDIHMDYKSKIIHFHNYNSIHNTINSNQKLSQVEALHIVKDNPKASIISLAKLIDVNKESYNYKNPILFQSQSKDNNKIILNNNNLNCNGHINNNNENESNNHLESKIKNNKCSLTIQLSGRPTQKGLTTNNNIKKDSLELKPQIKVLYPQHLQSEIQNVINLYKSFNYDIEVKSNGFSFNNNLLFNNNSSLLNEQRSTRIDGRINNDIQNHIQHSYLKHQDFFNYNYSIDYCDDIKNSSYGIECYKY